MWRGEGYRKFGVLGKKKGSEFLEVAGKDRDIHSILREVAGGTGV